MEKEIVDRKRQQRLSWKPILSNLREALGEINQIHLHLHYLTFGELYQNRDASYLAWFKKKEERCPFNQTAFFVRLEHAYHHLNWAWNCRRTPEERVWHFSDRDAARWTRFPDTKEFADLWPSDRTVRGCADKLQRKKICAPSRSFVYSACRKGDILCYLVAKELGEDWARPQGLFPEVGKEPLTEKDFARRMHRIYKELNMAWNSRDDKTFVTGKRAIDRRGLFPSIFATGSHNLWRK